MLLFVYVLLFVFVLFVFVLFVFVLFVFVLLFVCVFVFVFARVFGQIYLTKISNKKKFINICPKISQVFVSIKLFLSCPQLVLSLAPQKYNGFNESILNL